MGIGIAGGLVLSGLIMAAVTGYIWLALCGYILAAILAAICKLRAGRKKEVTHYPQW